MYVFPNAKKLFIFSVFTKYTPHYMYVHSRYWLSMLRYICRWVLCQTMFDSVGNEGGIGHRPYAKHTNICTYFRGLFVVILKLRRVGAVI